jgi:hypothetical protein
VRDMGFIGCLSSQADVELPTGGPSVRETLRGENCPGGDSWRGSPLGCCLLFLTREVKIRSRRGG